MSQNQNDEHMNTLGNTDRVTRGAENRRPTEKYALFQQSKQSLLTLRPVKRSNKASRNSSNDSILSHKSPASHKQQDGGSGATNGANDDFIMTLCKQQSFKKNQDNDELVGTANSTPEKSDKCTLNTNEKKRQTLEFEDLDDILENTKERFMKSKQLALEEQRSSSYKKPACVHQNSLMPKRIMSSKNKVSLKKDTEPKETPVKKAPKDRSALIGLKRTRKSRDQIYRLQKIYEDALGKPTKAELKQLAKDTGLKLQQVYKWYWDTEKKNAKLQKELTNNDPDVNSPLRISRKILKTQYTDEFGGYSKTWFTDGLQEMKNQQEGEEEADNVDDFDDCDKEQLDGGMDGLARSLGLDIEALALELAMNDSTPPTQCLPVPGSVETSAKATQALTEQLNETAEAKESPLSSQVERARYVLMKAKGTQYSPLFSNRGTQCSPIINPIVIRPHCQNNNTFQSRESVSNASASNVSSIVSKRSKAQPKAANNNNPFQPFGARNQQGTSGGDTFHQEKIQQAFQNLFGGSFGGNNASSNLMQTPQMQTPQFSDNKHQIKAKPIYNVLDTPGNFLNNKPNANARSVFSPIPCQPQSECSILGVRGDRNTPYTPFNRQNDVFTPRISPVVGAGLRKAFNTKQANNGQEPGITPGQFLRTAQPVGQQNTSSLSRATPKNPANVYNLYAGPNPAAGAAQSPFVKKQTPKQFVKPAQGGAFGGLATSPARHQTIINLYTQPVSCSNFYNGCPGNNSCAEKQANKAESNSSFSNNASPTPQKTII